MHPHVLVSRLVPLALLVALWGTGCESPERSRPGDDATSTRQAKALPAEQVAEGPADSREPAGEQEEQAGSPDERPATVRSKLTGLLGGFEHIPTKKELDHQGEPEEVAGALRAIYRDQEVMPIKRTRALSALRFYPTEETRQLYEDVLQGEQTPEMDRRIAVKAYGKAFEGEAVPMLADLLDHADYHTRDAAVRTLADIAARDDGDAARAALRRRLKQETEEPIRRRIRQALPDVPGSPQNGQPETDRGANEAH